MFCWIQNNPKSRCIGASKYKVIGGRGGDNKKDLFSFWKTLIERGCVYYPWLAISVIPKLERPRGFAYLSTGGAFTGQDLDGPRGRWPPEPLIKIHEIKCRWLKIESSSQAGVSAPTREPGAHDTFRLVCQISLLATFLPFAINVFSQLPSFRVFSQLPFF